MNTLGLMVYSIIIIFCYYYCILILLNAVISRYMAGLKATWSIKGGRILVRLYNYKSKISQRTLGVLPYRALQPFN